MSCARRLAPSAPAPSYKVGQIGATAARPAGAVGGARTIGRELDEQLLESDVAPVGFDEALQEVLPAPLAVSAGDAHYRVGIARQRLPLFGSVHINAVAPRAATLASGARCAAARPPWPAAASGGRRRHRPAPT